MPRSLQNFALNCLFLLNALLFLQRKLRIILQSKIVTIFTFQNVRYSGEDVSRVHIVSNICEIYLQVQLLKSLEYPCVVSF